MFVTRRISPLLLIFALLAPAGGAIAQVPEGYFRLQSLYLENENKCLEGNRVVSDATIAGASFMADCGNFSGQLWRAEPLDNGYYRLTTMYREADDECLEGGKPFTPGDALQGAARMDPCGNFSGQMWKFIPQANGYFQMTNLFLEPENRCLESGRLENQGDPLNGAARMDPCGNFSGQMWRLVPQHQETSQPVLDRASGAGAASECAPGEHGCGPQKTAPLQIR